MVLTFNSPPVIKESNNALIFQFSYIKQLHPSSSKVAMDNGKLEIYLGASVHFLIKVSGKEFYWSGCDDGELFMKRWNHFLSFNFPEVV